MIIKKNIFKKINIIKVKENILKELLNYMRGISTINTMNVVLFKNNQILIYFYIALFLYFGNI